MNHFAQLYCCRVLQKIVVVFFSLLHCGEMLVKPQIHSKQNEYVRHLKIIIFQ